MRRLLPFARHALLLLALAAAGCAGGTFIDLPLVPRETCPTCWDDLYQGEGASRRR
jgi:hypothetical protein